MSSMALTPIAMRARAVLCVIATAAVAGRSRDTALEVGRVAPSVAPPMQMVPHPIGLLLCESGRRCQWASLAANASLSTAPPERGLAEAAEPRRFARRADSWEAPDGRGRVTQGVFEDSESGLQLSVRSELHAACQARVAPCAAVRQWRQQCQWCQQYHGSASAKCFWQCSQL